MKLEYEKEMITERDYYNMLNTAKADGLAAGLAEGEAKGREEGRAEGRNEEKIRIANRNEEKIRIAKVLKEEGVDFLMIANATGLSKNEIAML